jgi:hypothetical protein
MADIDIYGDESDVRFMLVSHSRRPDEADDAEGSPHTDLRRP